MLKNNPLQSDKPFIIAEIGGNHEGDFKYAKKLLKLAATTGVDAVKFQIYRGNKIANESISPDRVSHFKKFELTDDKWRELIALANQLGVMFMASVWDLESLEKYDPFLKIHKMGSGDLTSNHFLKATAKKNKPLILSTAMSNVKEIKNAVSIVKKTNPRLIKQHKFALLQCVAMYGNPKNEYANLLSIKKLQDEFPDVIIGYSDHTKGIYACELAMAMGAKVIEKHFTDDKSREFRDHHISADPDEMKQLVTRARDISIYLGKYEKKPIESVETPQRIKEFRRAVYPSCEIKAGEKLTYSNTVLLRPNEGIDARDYDKVIGKRLRVTKRRFEKLSLKDLK